MFDRTREGGLPPQQACYFDEVLDRWVLFYELPAEERAQILDPALWDEIEAQRWSDAPTRIDVGLGPKALSPDVLAALTHRGSLHDRGRGRPRWRPAGRLGTT